VGKKENYPSIKKIPFHNTFARRAVFFSVEFFLPIFYAKSDCYIFSSSHKVFKDFLISIFFVEIQHFYAMIYHLQMPKPKTLLGLIGIGKTDCERKCVRGGIWLYAFE